MDKLYKEMLDSRGVIWTYGDIPQPSTYMKLFGVPMSMIRHGLPRSERNWAACHESAHHDYDHGDWPGWWLDIGSNRLWLEGQANGRGVTLGVPLGMFAPYRRELRDGQGDWVVWQVSEKTRLPHRIVAESLKALFFRDAQ